MLVFHSTLTRTWDEIQEQTLYFTKLIDGIQNQFNKKKKKKKTTNKLYNISTTHTHTHTTTQIKTTKDFIADQISKTNWGNVLTRQTTRKGKRGGWREIFTQNSDLYINRYKTWKKIRLANLHECVRVLLGAPFIEPCATSKQKRKNSELVNVQWRKQQAGNIQDLDEAVCISHNTNTLWKGMNPIILPPPMGKY